MSIYIPIENYRYIWEEITNGQIREQNNKALTQSNYIHQWLKRCK